MVTIELDLGQKRAEELVEKLPQYEPGASPSLDVREAVRAAGTMANLALFSWNALQQLVANGVEGGRARELVENAALTLSTWRTNISIAIRPVEQWQEKVAFAFSLDELRNLENRLQEAYSMAERLLQFVSSHPPELPQEVLDKLEAIGRDDDPTSYLDSDTFLARMRAHAGS
jgi:hypothetical protein